MKQNQTPFPINDLFEFIESNFVLGQGSLSGQNVKIDAVSEEVFKKRIPFRSNDRGTNRRGSGL